MGRKNLTMAERFARLFHDGACWETKTGLCWDEALTKVQGESYVTISHARRIRDDNNDFIHRGDGTYELEECYSGAQIEGDPTRYIFCDGSAIVEAGDAWDIEGDTPFSWRG